jgi:hypothetical protein
MVVQRHLSSGKHPIDEEMIRARAVREYCLRMTQIALNMQNKALINFQIDLPIAFVIWHSFCAFMCGIARPSLKKREKGEHIRGSGSRYQASCCRIGTHKLHKRFFVLLLSYCLVHLGYMVESCLRCAIRMLTYLNK